MAYILKNRGFQFVKDTMKAKKSCVYIDGVLTNSSELSLLVFACLLELELKVLDHPINIK